MFLSHSTTTYKLSIPDIVTAGRILETVTESANLIFSPNTIIRKLTVKLVQRIGLVYLKTKVASWRYVRSVSITIGKIIFADYFLSIL